MNCVKHKISEELARNEHEAWEREARHVLFYQNYQLRVEVEEHQRQARYAPGRRVQESS